MVWGRSEPGRGQSGGRRQERLDLLMAVEVRGVCRSGGNGAHGLGHIHARIACRQVPAQLSDHGHAVTPGAWSKRREALLIGLNELAGQAWFIIHRLLGHKAVERPKQ
jgi:hypothetical protein